MRPPAASHLHMRQVPKRTNQWMTRNSAPSAEEFGWNVAAATAKASGATTVSQGKNTKGGNAMSDQITINKTTLQAIFDIAISSLDFSSGFLDNEDVEHLREVAVILGLEPMVGTPTPFTLQYPHKFKTKKIPASLKDEARIQMMLNTCDWCYAHPHHEVHNP
jgi:hypothetical protein